MNVATEHSIDMMQSDGWNVTKEVDHTTCEYKARDGRIVKFSFFDDNRIQVAFEGKVTKKLQKRIIIGASAKFQFPSHHIVNATNMNTSKISKPSYKTNDPKGWRGDPSRGAAIGRGTLRGDVSYDGKLTLQRIRLDSGGYDCNGTYFGYGAPLYWYAANSDDTMIDGMIRAKNRNAAKALILQEYPEAKFYR